MKLQLNREFLTRHLFALGVFVVLCGWFGLDAFVRYPSASAHDLYVAIEKSEPDPAANLEAFKAQKIATQRLFTLLMLLAGAAVGLHLLGIVRFAFVFDDEGFTCGGVRRAYSEIETVDTADWEKKSILRIAGKGWKIKLDAWHHTGVKEFEEKIRNRS